MSKFHTFPREEWNFSRALPKKDALQAGQAMAGEYIFLTFPGHCLKQLTVRGEKSKVCAALGFKFCVQDADNMSEKAKNERRWVTWK